MPIDPTGSPDIRAGGAQNAPETASTDKTDRAPNRVREDQVHISEEARSLAEQASVDRVPFTEARAAEIQGRLETGFYEQPEVVRAIAEKLVDSGDL